MARAERREETVSRVPILSSIPVLGNLFVFKHKLNEVDSLIILITPHILKSSEQTDRIFENAHQEHMKRDFFYNKYEKPRAMKQGQPPSPPIGTPDTPEVQPEKK